MAGRRLLILVAAVSGVVSGTVVALLISFFLQGPANHDSMVTKADSHTPSLDQEQPSMGRPAMGANAMAQANRRDIGWLEERVDKLADALPSEETVLEADAAAAHELTPEEARAADLRWWEETQAAFENESVDSQWAASTTDLFAADLDQLAEEHGYASIHTECRSSRCKAVVEWPTYSDATRQFPVLLHHTYQANCARHTLLPQPSEETTGEPYQVTVIFDCSDAQEHG